MTSTVSPICSRCGLPFVSREGEDHTCSECLTERKYFRKARAFGIYQGALMEAIHQLKYGGKTSLSKPLSTLAKETFYRFWDASSTDLLLPVPLHIKRLRERGFNQTHLVNKKWARLEGIPFDGLTLSRSRWTEPQTSLARAERRKNVKGAFSLLHPDRVKGVRILLVDDVFTTGATVNECSKVLMKAGAESVDVLTLARAV
jgi:ComF family protein